MDLHQDLHQEIILIVRLLIWAPKSLNSLILAEIVNHLTLWTYLAPQATTFKNRDNPWAKQTHLDHLTLVYPNNQWMQGLAKNLKNIKKRLQIN